MPMGELPAGEGGPKVTLGRWSIVTGRSSDGVHSEGRPRAEQGALCPWARDGG